MDTKLPNSLIEYLNRCKEYFDLAQRVGLAKGVTWEEHSTLLKKEYAHMKSMDDQKLKEYLAQRHQTNVPMYEAFLAQDAKMRAAGQMRREIGAQVNEMKKEKRHGK